MADLICFPQQRNIGKARHVSAVYLSKTSARERETYWRLIVNRLSEVMMKCGFSQSEIQFQLAAFHCTVQNQIDTCQRSTATVPGGEPDFEIIDADRRPQ